MSDEAIEPQDIPDHESKVLQACVTAFAPMYECLMRLGVDPRNVVIVCVADDLAVNRAFWNQCLTIQWRPFRVCLAVDDVAYTGTVVLRRELVFNASHLAPSIGESIASMARPRKPDQDVLPVVVVTNTNIGIMAAATGT